MTDRLDGRHTDKRTMREQMFRIGFALMLSALGMTLAGCQLSKQSSDVQVEGKVAGHVDCGDERMWVNTGRTPRRVQITAVNDCEFTAYLWIRFSPDHVIPIMLGRGEQYSDTVMLPPNGKVEFWCSLVSSSWPGCTFSVTPL